ncbi:MAG: bifunctional 2-C-methyl-D-erythritol 4-phosphate cytidylyltransferase/2-C-methyl-D-erythritol 2,4-cyclodiphosphate synthase [Alphaproteobacteria bacterium]|nr:bifunctional 2-C-methyl-D-erythritol 4-phosphate cytidylyltransferase/2-C-methyl-D-erythritol 2,4-cyclodiphosphate synthase [Alphaproteobacteria bacterium]
MRNVALIVAAGRGSRAGGERGVKQYVALGARTVLARAADVFLRHPAIGHVQVVIHADDQARYSRAMASVKSHKLLPPAVGGATRQHSVHAGLMAIAAMQPDHVLIHDAARPFFDDRDIDGVLAALVTQPGAICAVPVVDTLKRAEGEPALIEETVARRSLWRAQTPQGFRFADILAAHEQAASRDDFTDDASIAEAAGLGVAIVEGSERNFKITTPADFARAEKEIAGMASEFRTGTGFDVHRFTTGDHVWLCGVRVPHDAALTGHSDADVAMHALTDAIYGAIAEGDIGHHFPPSEAQWKGAASRLFLEHARERLAARGARFVNADITIICERPKIGPHRDAMRYSLAEILDVEASRIAVKATTSEGLGFTGRGEGIAAMASVMIAL